MAEMIWRASDGSGLVIPAAEMALLGDAGPLDCQECGGGGEIGVFQDYWGNWETVTCPVCKGFGVEA